LQRCPRNSVEQLGQIEDASFFRFAATRFAATRFAATPAAVSTDLDADPEAAEFRGEFGVEVMSGVVAQIRSQKNMNLGETGEASHQQS
jgi:hypothetical protein